MADFKQVLFVNPQRKIELLICIKIAGVFDPIEDLPNILSTSAEVAATQHIALSGVVVEITDDVDIYYFGDLYTSEAKRGRHDETRTYGANHRGGQAAVH